ncbi:hypothetical protein J1N35_043716 [Gossypium stocksii]|uniref:Uncharacterized protein n=1 Tax=Gossypium stocksii TaxID=47602 RepID=A0A9D3U7Y7_9ROSI|nr:hypothetical protein J1N35_043716 [Gossypium stocksii]
MICADWQNGVEAREVHIQCYQSLFDTIVEVKKKPSKENPQASQVTQVKFPGRKMLEIMKKSSAAITDAVLPLMLAILGWEVCKKIPLKEAAKAITMEAAGDDDQLAPLKMIEPRQKLPGMLNS